MRRGRTAIVVVIGLIILAVTGVTVWKRLSARPAGVPPGAELVDGYYIDCVPTYSWFGAPCKIYDRRSGQLVDRNPLALRLGAFAKKYGGALRDCGKTSGTRVDPKVADCVQEAFKSRVPFTAQYFTDSPLFVYGYGIAGNARGGVTEVTYDSRGFPPVAPNKRTQLLDGNKVRLAACAEPTALGIDAGGLIGCITPVGKSAPVTTPIEPINTTVCAIADNPAAFNNKLVRVKASYSGNFEYSMLSQDGCSQSIWFSYASEDSPPGLLIHVDGGAMPGTEDEAGRRIRPTPVSLVRDENFKRFQQLMTARVKAEKDANRTHKGEYVSYRVTATFVGRVDGVSPEIHEFHKRRSDNDRADFLGFGQMGLFDAQFVMQSVEGDAVLERER